MRALRLLAALANLSALLTLVACSTSEADARHRAGVQEALEAYQPRLAEAYVAGDAELLRGLADERELATLEKKLVDRAAEGQFLEPAFKSLEIESLEVRDGVVEVVTLELWDLNLYDANSRALLKQSLDQRNRVKYELRRDGERWIVVSRQIEKIFE